jgi:ankyrin repeat protein
MRRTMDKNLLEKLQAGGGKVFSVDQRTKKGITPLMMACEAGNATAVAYLVNHAGQAAAGLSKNM